MDDLGRFSPSLHRRKSYSTNSFDAFEEEEPSLPTPSKRRLRRGPIRRLRSTNDKRFYMIGIFVWAMVLCALAWMGYAGTFAMTTVKLATIANPSADEETVAYSNNEGLYGYNNVKKFDSNALFGVKPSMVQIDMETFVVQAIPGAPETEFSSSRQVSELGGVASYHSPKSPLRLGCENMGEWQASMHPTCSSFHEIDLTYFFHEENGQDETRLVNNGAYRDVWMVREFNGTKRALKSLRYISKRKFDQRNFDRHRRDAVAYEQLSASPHVADIYGYCANSALFDFCESGNLAEILTNPAVVLEDNEKLEIAHVVAAAVADSHNYDEEGRATIAHTDIKPNQFIFMHGQYKLNDFNRARLLSWNPATKMHCGFEVGKNGGIWRSPEEYRYKLETEKVDVWSLGLVLYFILTGKEPYDEFDRAEDVYKFVSDGGRATVENKRILESNHPYQKAMLKAMDMCFVFDPRERASARQVADLLHQALQTLK